VEATGNTRLFYDAVVKRVARVRVVNPTQCKVIHQSVKKTDSNDAELLALYLSKGLLPEVRMTRSIATCRIWPKRATCWSNSDRR
jgi:hypothetical protein